MTLFRLFVVTAAILSQCVCVSGNCSRLLSRRVRKFLQNEVFSRLQIDPQELPLQCQLNPIHDIYFDQEEVIMITHIILTVSLYYATSQ
jgi:hypothetical protein